MDDIDMCLIFINKFIHSADLMKNNRLFNKRGGDITIEFVHESHFKVQCWGLLLRHLECWSFLTNKGCCALQFFMCLLDSKGMLFLSKTVTHINPIEVRNLNPHGSELGATCGGGGFNLGANLGDKTRYVMPITMQPQGGTLVSLAMEVKIAANFPFSAVNSPPEIAVSPQSGEPLAVAVSSGGRNPAPKP
nr:hypothetical protein Iba_chr02fCG8550 [Ipomoea batatas]GME14979.1 hypothetical protein Iba_scaffold15672CG0010 [Ipomoea batatas]